MYTYFELYETSISLLFFYFIPSFEQNQPSKSLYYFIIGLYLWTHCHNMRILSPCTLPLPSEMLGYLSAHAPYHMSHHFIALLIKSLVNKARSMGTLEMHKSCGEIPKQVGPWIHCGGDLLFCSHVLNA